MNIFSSFISLFPINNAYAHCDIPCGIYDPHEAQMAAHTVIRMISLIGELPKLTPESTHEERQAFVHKMARYTTIKEEHAERIKHEVRVIWGDYFKPEHLKEYPKLHDHVFQIMKLASKARQETNMDVAQGLLASVQEFAEIFFKTKGLTPVRVKAPYPTDGEIVLHK